MFQNFDSDLLIICPDQLYETYSKILLADKVNSERFTIEVKQIEKNNSPYQSGWVYNKPWFNFCLSDKFIDNHFKNKSQEYIAFTTAFEAFLQPFKEISLSKENKRAIPLALFVCSYKTKQNKIFKFILDIDEDAPLVSFNEISNTIIAHNQRGRNELKSAIKKTFTQPDKILYFIFSDNKWNVLNPLHEIIKDINSDYRKNKDARIKKPFVILNNTNLRQKMIYDTNWVLKFDSLETLLIKPNDVAIYSSICDKNLEKAKEFFENTILPRHKHYYGTFPQIKEQQRYFDYFELIITALIFSYTALEAFANICIPDNFEYSTEKDGIKTIFSKKAIERRYSLREKFKVILSSVLDTPDPTKEKWWNNFIDLEDLRNEIIHTKQSKSEVRYSQFLTKSVFKIIGIHKEIIKHYGQYISKNKKELLKEYPYDFGFDEFMPGLMTKKNFEENLRSIHNIPKKTSVRKLNKK